MATKEDEWEDAGFLSLLGVLSRAPEYASSSADEDVASKRDTSGERVRCLLVWLEVEVDLR